MSKIYGIDVSPSRRNRPGQLWHPNCAASTVAISPGLPSCARAIPPATAKGGLLHGQPPAQHQGREQYGVPMGIYVYCYDRRADAGLSRHSRSSKLFPGTSSIIPSITMLNMSRSTKRAAKAVNTAIIKSALEVWEKAAIMQQCIVRVISSLITRTCLR